MQAVSSKSIVICFSRKHSLAQSWLTSAYERRKQVTLMDQEMCCVKVHDLLTFRTVQSEALNLTRRCLCFPQVWQCPCILFRCDLKLGSNKLPEGQIVFICKIRARYSPPFYRAFILSDNCLLSLPVGSFTVLACAITDGPDALRSSFGKWQAVVVE